METNEQLLADLLSDVDAEAIAKMCWVDEAEISRLIAQLTANPDETPVLTPLERLEALIDIGIEHDRERGNWETN